MTAMKRIKEGENMEEMLGAYDEDILARGQKEAALSLSQAMASHSIWTFAKSPLATIGARAG